MSEFDFNLLVTLDALLAEASVAKAAQRLKLSPSAMSRALARLRAVTGDPLLVRAGRGLALTTRAMELRDRVADLVRDGEAVLRPSEQLNLAQLTRTFTLRVGDGFVENFGATLVARVVRQAPGVLLCFLPRTDRSSAGLRDGSVDLETGVVSTRTGPEVWTQTLFRDRFIGVVRASHPLREGLVTPARYVAWGHVLDARHHTDKGPIDESLKALGMERKVAAVVGGFSSALALARDSELIATVPERHTQSLRLGMHGFPLPFTMPEIVVSMLWHPRQDADPAHRWLRQCVKATTAPGEHPVRQANDHDPAVSRR
ncbi:LysR family transcriptional regulator [Dyella sp.]|uniref:LysR family transcriptional regulator n=1 Tax=Dyella sp. TaxID=1869338 RepID=UPI002ED443EB